MCSLSYGLISTVHKMYLTAMVLNCGDEISEHTKDKLMRHTFRRIIFPFSLYIWLIPNFIKFKLEHKI